MKENLFKKTGETEKHIIPFLGFLSSKADLFSEQGKIWLVAG